MDDAGPSARPKVRTTKGSSKSAGGSSEKKSSSRDGPSLLSTTKPGLDDSMNVFDDDDTLI